MAIDLGKDPIILIILSFLEILLILIPALIASKVEKKPFLVELKEMGFQKTPTTLRKMLLKVVFGFLIGIIFFFISSFIQLIILVAIQVVIVAPCEEGFFRGFIIRKSHKKMKLFYSIIFSSFIFTIYHVPPFLVPLSTIVTFFGYYFSFGILLSLTFVLFKNSLLPSSIAHFTLNILILLF